MDASWLGQIGFTLPLGLGAIGSALGVGAAGRAAAGAWAKEAKAGKACTLTSMLSLPATITDIAYNFLVPLSIGLIMPDRKRINWLSERLHPKFVSKVPGFPVGSGSVR